MQLTQKESTLIKDMKSQEKLCVEKYTKNASSALDNQLKDLLTKIANVEQEHLNTLSQIESGNVPMPGAGQQTTTSFTATYGTADTPDKQSDSYLCSDCLAIEKHASSMYNTGIFEFRDTGVRDVLNHIQKEEQQHGKELYDYMSTNGMYS